MSVARLRLAPVGETMSPTAPFFQRQVALGNLPVPLEALPAHVAETGP